MKRGIREKNGNWDLGNKDVMHIYNVETGEYHIGLKNRWSHGVDSLKYVNITGGEYAWQMERQNSSICRCYYHIGGPVWENP